MASPVSLIIGTLPGSRCRTLQPSASSSVRERILWRSSGSNQLTVQRGPSLLFHLWEYDLASRLQNPPHLQLLLNHYLQVWLRLRLWTWCLWDVLSSNPSLLLGSWAQDDSTPSVLKLIILGGTNVVNTQDDINSPQLKGWPYPASGCCCFLLCSKPIKSTANKRLSAHSCFSSAEWRTILFLAYLLWSIFL